LRGQVLGYSYKMSRDTIHNMNTLHTPVLDRLLDPVGRMLTPDVARKLADFRFDVQSQSRLDLLARKCNEGRLTADERREYETYVNVMDFLGVLQAKARAVVRRSDA